MALAEIDCSANFECSQCSASLCASCLSELHFVIPNCSALRFIEREDADGRYLGDQLLVDGMRVLPVCGKCRGSTLWSFIADLYSSKV